MPKVSVLMAVYKTDETYLRVALESILNQTYTDFEFLILDDCPDDSREVVIKSYQDSRIKYFKNEKNLGITPTRNKLINLAQGEYLAVFDHDDISLPTRLEKEVAYLDTHPECGVVSCWFEFIGKKWGYKFPSDHDGIAMGIGSSFCFLLHPASMLRKSVLEKHHIRYEEAYSPAEDYMLWARLLQYTKFYNIPEVLFQYRSHPANTSSKQAARMERCRWEVMDYINHQVTPEYRKYNDCVYYWPSRKFPLFKIKSCRRERYSVDLFAFIPCYSWKVNLKDVLRVKICKIPVYKKKLKNTPFVIKRLHAGEWTFKTN